MSAARRRALRPARSSLRPRFRGCLGSQIPACRSRISHLYGVAEVVLGSLRGSGCAEAGYAQSKPCQTVQPEMTSSCRSALLRPRCPAPFAPSRFPQKGAAMR